MTDATLKSEALIGNNQKAEIKSGKQTQTAKIPNGVRKSELHSPPNLFHTTVRGEFGAISFSKWNDLLQIAHVQAFKKQSHLMSFGK